MGLHGLAPDFDRYQARDILLRGTMYEAVPSLKTPTRGPGDR